MTLIELERAKDIKKVGATGAYTKEFDEIQNQLHDIETLLNKSTSVDLGSIENKLAALAKEIDTTKTEDLKKLDDILANTSRVNKLTEVRLNNLKKDIEKLKNKTEELKKNGTNLQEQNVQGALEIVRQAKIKADEAVDKTKDAEVFFYTPISKLPLICAFYDCRSF